MPLCQILQQEKRNKHAWRYLTIKHFALEVLTFLKEKGLPQKAVLLLENAPFYPSKGILACSDGSIAGKFYPPTSHGPWSCSSIVGRVTRLGAGRSRVQIVVGARDIFLFSKMSRRALGPTKLHIQHVPGFYPRGTAAGTLGSEVNHSPPSGATVKNECNYTSTLPVRLYGIDRKTVLYL